MTAPPTPRVRRVGALLLLVLGVMLLLFAVLLPRVANSETTVVEGAAIALPEPGMLGSHATVYFPTEDLQSAGCRLVDQDGQPVPDATLDPGAVARADPVTVGDATFYPAFEVSGWPDGSYVECAPGEFALGAISTFGQSTGLVRIGVLVTGLVCLALAAVARASARPAGADR
ncbi:MAG TPA: hypothetical protein VK045_07685 [Ornithinicoccus sp.]|nr:hypothetical protein [Ornithinicoccus sp.]